MAEQSPPVTCRGCGHGALHRILDLGKVPLANSLLTTADAAAGYEDRFPLVLYFCPECYLVQIGETVIPERMFDHYLYASSFSDTMLRHARTLVERVIAERGIDSSDLVIEVASNDGYLLQYYKQRGIPVLGIEPAANIAAVAEKERGIPSLVTYFNAGLGAELAASGRMASVVHANNVFAHVPDPNSFLQGLRHVLKPEGAAIIEAPYVGDLIESLEFDTIYHEHFSYYSLSAVNVLCRRHGLQVSHVEHVPIHGGSLRYVVTHLGAAPVSAAVTAMLEAETATGMCTPGYYLSFSQRVAALKDELMALLRQLKAEGRSVAAYGASAKGSTLMNAYGIGADLLDFVVDRSTLKQGHFTPGNRLPILEPGELLSRKPDYVLLLVWNFAEEVLDQQKSFRDAGGRFIVPLPRVRIV